MTGLQRAVSQLQRFSRKRDRGSAPLPTTDKLRATPAPTAKNSAAFRNAAAPHPLEPAASSVARTTRQLRTSHTVTTTQCGVMRSRPPPTQSGGTRRPAVRSQSLATLQRIVCSYLLPGSWLLRSFLAMHRQRSGRMAVRHRKPEA
jgi:hypothetical protein